ncbi:hypothetical protein P9112_012575 [Eukaryota sp. TZLM1-RC]
MLELDVEHLLDNPQPSRLPLGRRFLCIFFFLVLALAIIFLLSIFLHSVLCSTLDHSQRSVFSFSKSKIQGISVDLPHAQVHFFYHNSDYINITMIRKNSRQPSNKPPVDLRSINHEILGPLEVLTMHYSPSFFSKLLDCFLFDVKIYLPKDYEFQLLNVDINRGHGDTAVLLPLITSGIVDITINEGIVAAPQGLFASRININSGVQLGRVELVELFGIPIADLIIKSFNEFLVLGPLHNGKATLSSTGGSISVLLSESWQGLFEMSSRFGALSLTDNKEKVSDLKKEKRNIEGRVGKGEDSVTLNSVEGTISVTVL